MNLTIKFKGDTQEIFIVPVEEINVKVGDRLVLLDLYAKLSTKQLYTDKKTISLVRIAVKLTKHQKVLSELYSKSYVDLDKLADCFEFFTVFYRYNFVPEQNASLVERLVGEKFTDVTQCLIALAGVAPRDLDEYDSDEEESTTDETEISAENGGFNELKEASDNSDSAEDEPLADTADGSDSAEQPSESTADTVTATETSKEHRKYPTSNLF